MSWDSRPSIFLTGETYKTVRKNYERENEKKEKIKTFVICFIFFAVAAAFFYGITFIPKIQRSITFLSSKLNINKNFIKIPLSLFLGTIVGFTFFLVSSYCGNKKKL